MLVGSFSVYVHYDKEKHFLHLVWSGEGAKCGYFGSLVFFLFLFLLFFLRWSLYPKLFFLGLVVVVSGS